MRQTNIITTPNQHKVEVWEYATGHDLREYQRALFSSLKLKPEGLQLGDQNPAGTVEAVPADVLVSLDEVAIKRMVVSVDGKKEDAEQAILDMRAEDYTFVVEALRGFFQPKQ